MAWNACYKQHVNKNITKRGKLYDNSLGLCMYDGVSRSFRTRRLERELQMVQLPLGAVVSLFCESV